MDTEYFYSYYNGYTVLRCDFIDSIPYTPSKYVPMINEGNPLAYIDYPVVPYLGNKCAIVNSGTRTIKLLIANSYYTHLIVTRNGEAWNQDGTTDPYDVTGLTEISINCAEGFAVYTAKLATYSGGSISAETIACEWCVRPTTIVTTSVADGSVNVTDTILGMEFKPWYIVFGTSSSDTSSNVLKGKAIRISDDYTVTDNGDGTYTYSFSVPYPETSPTHMRVGIHSLNYGSASKDVTL